MFTEEFDDESGRRVWLSKTELDTLLEVPDDERHKIAFALGARGGLRSHEIVLVAPTHTFLDEDAGGWYLRVPEGKGDKYRETPIPDSLAGQLRGIAQYREADDDVPVIDTTTRTLRRWVQDAREQLAAETDDERWNYLSTHDLRRTWAGQLANDDVKETVALRWGGWEDLETFLNHYRGEATAEAQRREREKVDWL